MVLLGQSSGGCHYCRATVPRPDRTRDHIVPVRYGGISKGWNLVLCCKPCNSAKADTFPSLHCVKCAIAIQRWAAGERRMLSVTRELQVHDIIMTLQKAGSDTDEL